MQASHAQRQAAQIAPTSLDAGAHLGEDRRTRAQPGIGEVQKVAAHQTLFWEGDAVTHYYKVLSGSLIAYKMLPDGRRQSTGFLFPGDVMGLASDGCHSHSAEAIEDACVCAYPIGRLEARMHEDPEVGSRLFGLACSELAAARSQILLLGRKTAQERVVSFLLDLSARARARGEAANPVQLPMTRGDIADYLGLTLETVSRVLSELKQKRLIAALAPREFQLLRMDALEEIAAQ